MYGISYQLTVYIASSVNTRRVPFQRAVERGEIPYP